MGFPRGSVSKEATYSAGDPGREDPLEKGMSTHSSILAWGIPWTLAVKNLPASVGTWVGLLVRIDSIYRAVTSELMYHNY